MKTSMKTFFCKLATVVLVCFCTFQLNAQRSLTVPGGEDPNDPIHPYGYNLYWDFKDGVLRIWSTEDWKNPQVYSSFKDEILPYKAYVREHILYEYVEDEELLPTGDDHWGIPEGGVLMHVPLFNEVPWYHLRQFVRQVQIAGKIHTVGHFAFTYLDNLRSVILNDGVEKLCTGAFNHCSNLAHIYFPSSLDYIGPLSFVPYPFYKHRPVELVCNLTEPVELIRPAQVAYYVVLYTISSWCFSNINEGDSHLHLSSENLIPVFKDYRETFQVSALNKNNRYSYYERIKNIVARTQPVVEGVDIVGGDITLAPTLYPRHQLSATLYYARS
jgi:hypothetical protein